MNRSILIVICDFLLLSLLAFSTVDVNKVADSSATARLQLGVATNSPVDITKDLTTVMKQALDDEHKSQTQLRGDLERAREDAARQQALVAQREQQAAALDEKARISEQHALTLQQELQTRDRQVQALDEKAQTTEKKAQTLQQELQARDRQVQALDEKTLAFEQKALVLQQELEARDRQMRTLDEKTQASEKKALALQQELDARDRQVQVYKEELTAREQQALKLEQERAALQQQYAAAETNIATLNQQLKQGAAEGVMSREKLAALEDQVRHQLEQSLSAQRQLTELMRSNQAVVVEKERLSGRLQVAEAEKRIATGQVAKMEDEIKAAREERLRLADNIKTLANKSGELAQEMRETRPLAPNAIFNDFTTNRVDTQFIALRAGVFGGESTKTKETQTVLVNDGTNTYALCHVQETPLTLWQPGVDWDSLSGTLSRNAASIPIHSLSFAVVDPRIILMPVSPEEAHRLGCRIYQVCADPFKFQDAVLVGAREGYYGQCSFQIDTTTPDYVKLDRNVLKGLFGKFNPSRGDLVFSKTGELLGVMANSTYCLMLRSFGVEATFRFGPESKGQRTGIVLAKLHADVSDLPSKLQ